MRAFSLVERASPHGDSSMSKWTRAKVRLVHPFKFKGVNCNRYFGVLVGECYSRRRFLGLYYTPIQSHTRASLDLTSEGWAKRVFSRGW